ncbi:MAG: hypothetical protein H6Q52_2954 [Deltaproteobacteria bacterium]|nr:hypothetical protein [Deltaproteobacteria bacterium]
MPAYFLVEILEINDPDRYSEYIAGVKEIVQGYDGEYVIRTDHISLFFGESWPVRIILIKFEDTKSLEKCFNSDEYKKLAPLREASTKARAFVVEEG